MPMPAKSSAAPAGGSRFQTRTEVDFVVIGSGAAGGVLAKELSTAGFSVVVLEQGPYLRPSQFRHDELGGFFNFDLLPKPSDFPTTFRKTEKDEATVQAFPPSVLYAKLVGGSSVHFTANYWRFRPIDFVERSRIGPIEGTGFADWPITYPELEPYYTKVDWEVGVSGAPGPGDPFRSRPYPLPPLPVKSSGVLLEQGARKLGLHAVPAPMAILSRPHNNPARGVAQVLYWDQDGREQAQRAKAVVVSANGGETARLLLLSESSRFPGGLANSSGTVGKYLMLNGYCTAYGYFEHPLNEYKSVQVTRVIMDHYDTDPARGCYGGGGIDARFDMYPVLFGLGGLPGDAPQWGPEYKRMLAEYYTHTMAVAGHSTSLPLLSNSISLDPKVKDKYGRPALRLTYQDHPDDLKILRFFQGRCKELLDAAGAKRVWANPVQEQNVAVHLLGTCRMGDHPAESVVDKYHRAHHVRNLFICAGSGLVPPGRAQPTMTIQALAFRAAAHIVQFARRGEI